MFAIPLQYRGFKRLLSLVSLIFLLAVSAAKAQSDPPFNGENHQNHANAIAANAQGNLVVTGWSCIDVACADDEAVTITFAFGAAKAWLSALGKTASGISVKLDAEGNSYVLYELNLTKGAAPQEVAVAKYNPAGVRQWIDFEYVPGTVIEGSGANLPALLAVSPAGNSYLAYAVSGASNPNTGNAYIIKYGPTGKRIWSKSPVAEKKSSTLSLPFGLGIDENENVLALVWNVDPITLVQQEAFISKYDTAGNLIRTFDAKLDNIGAFAVDPSGDSYVAGYLGAATAPAVIKFNCDGTPAWMTQANSPPSAVVALATDPAGDVFVAQTTEDVPVNGLDSNISIIKFNSAGTQQWITSYNDHAYGDYALSMPVAIAADSSGNVYVTAVDGNQGGEPPINPTNAVTIKYDNTGKQIWLQTLYDPLGLSVRPAGIALAAGQVWVAATGEPPAVTGSIITGSEWLVVSYPQ